MGSSASTLVCHVTAAVTIAPSCKLSEHMGVLPDPSLCDGLHVWLGLDCACGLQGRILVLETKPGQHKLHLVYEKETRGAVYTMSGFQVALPTVRT